MRDGDGLFEIDPAATAHPEAGMPGPVAKSFRAFDRHQVFLMPPSLDEWLPEDIWPGSCRALR